MRVQERWRKPECGGAPDNDVTDRTFQPAMFRSNALAESNISSMALTRATFQPERSELKALA
jgi:hypothetical protein